MTRHESLAFAIVLGVGCSLERQGDPATSSALATESASESGPEPGATCAELLAAEPGPRHIADNYWLCLWICDISHSDDNGDSNELARATYDALEPGQPDMCFELRTTLYECFAERTCGELDAFAHSSDPMAPCQEEFDALVPHIEVCGL